MTFLSINLVLGLQGGYHVAYSQGHKKNMEYTTSLSKNLKKPLNP